MADSVKVVAKNSKAYHDYFIEDKYEAGIELAGTEVKASGKETLVNFVQSAAKFAGISVTPSPKTMASMLSFWRFRLN